MDNDFWHAIAKNDYTLPDGHNAPDFITGLAWLFSIP